MANRKESSFCWISCPVSRGQWQMSSSSTFGWAGSRFLLHRCPSAPASRKPVSTLTLWTKLDEWAITTFISTLNLTWDGAGHSLCCWHMKGTAGSSTAVTSARGEWALHCTQLFAMGMSSMVTAVGNVSFHDPNKIEVTKAQLVTGSTPTPFPGTADPYRTGAWSHSPSWVLLHPQEMVLLSGL